MTLKDKIISHLVLVFAIILGLRFIPTIPLSSTVTQKQADFSVSGTGKITAIPDIATISLGIQISKPTVKSAKDEVNRITNQAVDTLKKLGLAEKDIKTENYSIYPEYDYSAGRSRISGYRVSSNLEVTVRDLEKVNDVIDQTANLGINTLGNISLKVNDDQLKKLQQQAREEAVKEAKTKAENLAQAAGMKLGRIINVSESEPYSPRPVFLAADAKTMQAGESTDIQVGSTDISLTVILTYETR